METDALTVKFPFDVSEGNVNTHYMVYTFVDNLAQLIKTFLTHMEQIYQI